MVALRKVKQFLHDTDGDAAVVEATILFPIILMIFAALVLLSMYLPVRATLQRATQYAATAIATETTDTWLAYDEAAMTYGKKGKLNNVYASLYTTTGTGMDYADKAETIVRKVEESGISIRTGTLTVDYNVKNYILHKEIVVTATRTIPVPVNLSFIRFPKEIPITVTSTAVAQKGAEFVSNVDLIIDFVDYLQKKYGSSFNIKEIFKTVGQFAK